MRAPTMDGTTPNLKNPIDGKNVIGGRLSMEDFMVLREFCVELFQQVCRVQLYIPVHFIICLKFSSSEIKTKELIQFFRLYLPVCLSVGYHPFAGAPYGCSEQGGDRVQEGHQERFQSILEEAPRRRPFDAIASAYDRAG